MAIITVNQLIYLFTIIKQQQGTIITTIIVNTTLTKRKLYQMK